MNLCGAKLHIADDHSENVATMICGLGVDHYGPHEERYPRGVGGRTTAVIVQWEGDDRVADPTTAEPK